MATTVIDDAKTVEQDSQPGLKDCRILLSEDCADNQRRLSFVLTKAGADVTIVENGQLALNAALTARDEGSPFDVILMDRQMPVLDGYEATRRLRRKDYTGLIVALTANAMIDDRKKCIDSGCDEFATKPIDRAKLIKTIRSASQRLVPTEAEFHAG